ncbi:MAG: DUF4367 domain-containing protein [Acutalibacteraceae bacterium]
MNEINKSLYTKLNLLIDAELDKDISELNADLISECVDGILRLKTENSYQLTAAERERNIAAIVKAKPTVRHKTKLIKILIAVAVIMALIVGSVFAYTVIEYKIHDYDTYSTVWSNIIPKNIDKPIIAEYIPEGYELDATREDMCHSSKTYRKGDKYITISKGSSKAIDIDTENGETKIVTLDDTDYILFGPKEQKYGVVWFSSHYVYAVVAILPDDELLKIAQSVS